MRFKIGIDLDGVVVDILPECVKFLKDNSIITTADKITNYYLYTQFPISKEDCQDHWKKVSSYSNAKLIEDSIDVISILSRLGNDIYFITSRPKDVAVYTVNWLRNIKVPYNNVIFTDDKRSVVESYGIDLFIDDSPVICNDLSDICKVYIFDAPYNTKVRNKNIERVKTWDEVLSRFQQNFNYDDKQTEDKGY